MLKLSKTTRDERLLIPVSLINSYGNTLKALTFDCLEFRVWITP
jgi:hypothetical protein